MSVSMASASTTMSQDGSPRPTNSTNDGRRPPAPSVTPGQQEESNLGSNGHTGAAATTSKADTDGLGENDAEEWLMSCRCDSGNGKTLVTLLNCLQHIAEHPSAAAASSSDGTSGLSSATTLLTGSRRSQKKQTIQPVTVFCTPAGFTFHVLGPAKQSEASIELQKSMFSHFRVLQDHHSNNNNNDDDNQDDWRAGGEFCVNLCTVLNALQLLGPLDHRTSVGWSYNLHQEIFKVELLQDGSASSSSSSSSSQGILCTSAIPGLIAADDPEGDSLSNAFRSAPVAARMMVTSTILRDLLPEWSSVAGASCATVTVSASRGLEIAVRGHYGDAWVQVPATGDHLVAPLELADRTKSVTRTYPLHSLLSSMKGLEIAEETCININADGILAIQHKTVDPSGRGCSNFVDFIMTCLEDEATEGEDASSQVSASQASASQASASQTTQSTTWRNYNNGQSPSQQQQQQSPETATARRRRRRRASPSPGGTVLTNTTGDDVEPSGSDTEDGGLGTPSERQKRQSLQHRSTRADLSDNDNDDDEEEHPSLSVAPLFGTVVHDPDDPLPQTTSRRRRPRRTRSRPPPQPPGKRSRSRNNSDNEGEANESSDEDEPLDITALPGSPGRGASRQEDCSSPELVYGK